MGCDPWTRGDFRGVCSRNSEKPPPDPLLCKEGHHFAPHTEGAGMTTKLMMLEVPSLQEWRSWLGKHYASSPGVWLVCYKEHTGMKSIPYEEAIREALCFGWVDSLVKRIDEDRYARKFTPRRPTSKWSDIN